MLKRRPLCLLIAPFKNRTLSDAIALKCAKRRVLDLGYVPVFSPDLLDDILSDHDPQEREVALDVARNMVDHVGCDERNRAVVVCHDRLTEGMALEIGRWEGIFGDVIALDDLQRPV